MFSSNGDRAILDREPRFDDITSSLKSVSKMPKAAFRETAQVIATARRFNEEVVRPRALELDRLKHEDPDYLPWDMVEEANRRGFYTMFIPKLFGGHGLNMPSLSCFMEEVASGCTGIANLIGVHYLGVATLCASWNLRVMNRVMRDTAEGERNGKPCLISLAITEPGAGTDVEELELVGKAKVTCHAERVPGGYRLNGNKIFISNGHLSTWHMTIAYTDLDDPANTTVMLAVRNGMEGFSFGRQEHKMGQKACPASELIFEDCFVPDDLVCFDALQAARHTRSMQAVTMQVIDYVLSGSRAGVGSFGTGVARGAYEEALRFASQAEVGGKLLINHEWAQCVLAEMYKNVALARLSYVETNYANGLYGLFKVLHYKPLFYLMKYLPQQFVDAVVQPFLNMDFVTWLFRKIYFDWQREDEYQRTSGWASLSKFSATDAGVRNCQLALELMGGAGVRTDQVAEKHLRDSKLLQIYEGTNQLNRLNLFKCLIGRSVPAAKVFED
ncbi:MAG: acyl-CoA/acyl-ACP dehydrogenase [Actinobacteria bacterium]|nr:acyl-CoA/acyl-ACP dehydrogenase [Actinomycetota bacterium]MBU1945130.1 acyl-CoA/acyl-ACP dehydrogenase [Actinomycetota bacterium]MBU2686419.1 acyl-CoA/acyl-ACP dehydrogenase [Actinomycetota bacterium]